MTQIKDLNGNGKIVVQDDGKTEIYVPHLGETLAFRLPLSEPHYFIRVMEEIDSQGLSRPTTAQTLSLVSLALQNRNEEHCKDILSTFRSSGLWTSTENLQGRNDVIVYDNVDGKMSSDRTTLLKLMTGDKAFRVVPHFFKSEKQSIDQLLKNSYVIAQVGGSEDMLNVIQGVARGVGSRLPYVSHFYSTSKDVKIYTFLDSGWDDGSLNFRSAYTEGLLRSCSASGVRIVKPKEKK